MNTKKAQNIKIIKNEEKPETPELLAASIVAIAEGFTKLTKGGITQRGIVTLLKDMPGMQKVGREEINLVLMNLPKLAGYYVKAAPKK